MRLIDADALKAVFEEKSSEAVCGVELCKAIIGRIDEAPTVDAEPVRHAKWVHLGGDEWCCSACGEIEHTEGSWEHQLKDREWKYCRTCGAKMYETQKKPCDDCQEFDCYGCEYSERKEE